MNTDEHGWQGSPGRTGHAAPAFTLIELLTVISIIALLAAIGAGLAGVAIRKGRESAMRAERDSLVTAIESYKADYNQYPPDNARNGVNQNPAFHQLYYELAGTVSSGQGTMYATADAGEQLTAGQIGGLFSGAGGFVNSVVPTEKPKGYLGNLKPRQRQAVQDLGGNRVTLLTVSAMDWPTRNQALVDRAPLASRVPAAFRKVNPWHYVSTHPTNNPASFDLWGLWASGKTVDGTNQYRILGNWKE